jgi:transposase
MSNVYSIYDMKKTIKKYISKSKSKVAFTLYTLLFTLSSLGLTSCTDTWDEHYQTGVTGEGTLWESIKNNQQLSNFARVIEATGYHKSLSSSQVFTVFAPTNDAFTDADANDIINKYQADLAKGLKGDKNTAIKEFVMNHIALYNYSIANESPDTTIRMMNGKYLGLTNSTFSGKPFTSTNTITGNGVLFTLGEKADYIYNLFEYVKSDPELDSVRNFLYMSDPYQFHKIRFNSKASVPGDIIKGQQHYLDSVTTTENEFLENWLDALLDNEDSTYYALMPTNKAWKEQYQKNVPLFQYDKQVLGRDSLMWMYPRLVILAGMQFNITDNPLLGKTEAIDSIVSPLAASYSVRKNRYGSYDIHPYLYYKPYSNPDGIFTDIKGQKVCSNGVMMKTDNWKVKREDGFNLPVICDPVTAMDSLAGETPDAKPTWTTTSVQPDNPFYNKLHYNDYNTLTPSNLRDMGVLLDFNHVLSNQKYDMYIVTVPAKAGNTLATDTLPTRFSVTLYWHDLDGKEVSKEVSDKDGGDISYDSSTRKQTFLTDPTKVHEIHIGTFEFPTCSYGLTEPQVKAFVNVNVRSSDVNKGLYTKTLRIDCMKLVPRIEK